MIDIFNDMGVFSLDVFPAATSVDHLLKMKYEVEEAMSEPKDLTEYADCILSLYAAAYKAGFTYEELSKACENKLKILKNREWERLEDGTYQHIS